MLSTVKGERLRKGEVMLRKMQKARNSNPKFALVMKDPLGNSAIISPNPRKVKKRRLTRLELQKIKYGQYAPIAPAT